MEKSIYCYISFATAIFIGASVWKRKKDLHCLHLEFYTYLLIIISHCTVLLTKNNNLVIMMCCNIEKQYWENKIADKETVSGVTFLCSYIVCSCKNESSYLRNKPTQASSMKQEIKRWVFYQLVNFTRTLTF